MIKKIILIVLTIILYIGLWSVAYYFAYNASIPYRDNSYFNEEVFKLYEDEKNDEKFLARFLGTKSAFTSSEKLYSINIKNKNEIKDLSLSIYPIYFTNKKVGSFIFIDKFYYNFKDTIINLNDRNRIDPGYEAYKKKHNLVPVFIQFRYKGKKEYSKPIILDPFRIYYFLKDENELEAFRILKDVKFTYENLLVSFSTFKNEIDPFSIIINKSLYPKQLEKSGWPYKETIKKYNLLVEKPNYSNYNSTIIKVMLGMSGLFIILTYLLFFHRIIFNKIRYRYRGKQKL